MLKYTDLSRDLSNEIVEKTKARLQVGYKKLNLSHPQDKPLTPPENSTLEKALYALIVKNYSDQDMETIKRLTKELNVAADSQLFSMLTSNRQNVENPHSFVFTWDEMFTLLEIKAKKQHKEKYLAGVKNELFHNILSRLQTEAPFAPAVKELLAAVNPTARSSAPVPPAASMIVEKRVREGLMREQKVEDKSQEDAKQTPASPPPVKK